MTGQANLLAILLVVGTLIGSPASTWAFRITSPVEGARVEAGSTVNVRLDPENAGILLGVMFMSSGNEGTVDSPANDYELEVLPPYRWTLQLSRIYVGPLTISAVGRVLGQKTGVAPTAEVTIEVVLPDDTKVGALRVRDDQRIIFMEVGETLKVYVYGYYSDNVERLVSSSKSGTTYTVLDPRIAEVDSEGLITVLEPGTTAIEIRNGPKHMQIEVRGRPASSSGLGP